MMQPLLRMHGTGPSVTSISKKAASALMSFVPKGGHSLKDACGRREIPDIKYRNLEIRDPIQKTIWKKQECIESHQKRRAYPLDIREETIRKTPQYENGRA
jgi:hypothetical protein